MRTQHALDGHAQECARIVVCTSVVWVWLVYQPVRATGSEDLERRQRNERDPVVYISLLEPTNQP